MAVHPPSGDMRFFTATPVLFAFASTHVQLVSPLSSISTRLRAHSSPTLIVESDMGCAPLSPTQVAEPDAIPTVSPPSPPLSTSFAAQSSIPIRVAPRDASTSYLPATAPPTPTEFQAWFDQTFRQLVQGSLSMKCPFWRRRAGDVVDFLIARHKSLLLPETWELSARTARAASAKPSQKARGLSIAALAEVVCNDVAKRQYYVTGRLSTAIYADDCYFDGPDPDMPVRSLRRYTDALRGLFDPELSKFELLALEPHGDNAFVVHWRLEGALKLPWRPQTKPYLGCTLYETGADGLVTRHTESWSISAFDAFVSTMLPNLGAPPAPESAQIRAAIAAACAASDTAEDHTSYTLSGDAASIPFFSSEAQSTLILPSGVLRPSILVEPPTTSQSCPISAMKAAVGLL